MDDFNTFTEESLRRLSYVDLQRCAKMHGIKANVKAEKLIVALVSENTKNPVLLKEEDAVVEINSVSDEHESENPSVRPRRRRTRTFSIEKPFSVETSDVSSITTPFKTTSSKCNTLIKSSIKSILSSRKMGKSNKSRNGICCRVSFITPDKKDLKISCNTPASSSIECRTQTPAAQRYSSAAKRKNCFITSPISETPNNIEKWFSKDESSLKNSKGEKANMVFCTEENKSMKAPLSSAKSAKKPELFQARNPNFKKIHQQVFDKMESLDEYQQRRQIRMCKLGKNCDVKSLLKVPARTLCRDKLKKNSSSTTLTLRSRRIISKIPIPFQGIQFIPSVTSIEKIKTDFTKSAETLKIPKSTTTSEKTCSKEKSKQSMKAGKEKVFRFGKGTSQKMPLSDVINTPQNDKSLVRKRTFDLKASLAKKLPYKPYKGSVKPLCSAKVNDRTVASGVALQPPSKIVVKKREGERNLLKGVRKNRRFELQMSHRGLAV